MPEAQCRGLTISRTVLLTALVTVAALWQPAQSLVTLTLGAGDGQLFADAVAQYGTTGEDTLLLLPQGQVFSLLNVTIKDAQSVGGRTPFSSGTLTIRPGPGNSTAPTVLDTGMRFALTSSKGLPVQPSGTAKFVIEDLVLVNLCEFYFIRGPTFSLGWFSAFAPGFLPGSVSYQGLSFINTTWYIRQADFTAWLGGILTIESPFEEISKRYEMVNATVVRISVAPSLFSAHGYSVLNQSVPGWSATNMTVLSTADPDDPLLQTLRSRNILLPHVRCTPFMGPTNPQYPQQVQPLAPLWLTTDTTSFVGALSQATNNYSVPSPVFIPIFILVGGNTVPSTLFNSPYIAPLNNTMVLTGNIVLETTPPVQGVLDLTDLPGPLLTIKPTGQLYLQYMRIRGLLTNVLPGAGTPSVFPLSSFVSDTAGTSVTLRMYNVTLELPDYDYLALMALAQPALTAALNATALNHLAALRAGIQSFAVGDNSTGVSSLYVSSFQGWGINTTSIFFEPASPSLSLDILRYQQSLNGGGSMSALPGVTTNSGPSWGQLAGVAVGTLIGGFVLGALAMWAANRVYKSRSERPEPIERGRNEEKRLSATCDASVCVVDLVRGNTGSSVAIVTAQTASIGTSKPSEAPTLAGLSNHERTASKTEASGSEAVSNDVASGSKQSNSPAPQSVCMTATETSDAQGQSTGTTNSLLSLVPVPGSPAQLTFPRPSQLDTHEIEQLQSFVGQASVLQSTDATASEDKPSDRLTLVLGKQQSAGKPVQRTNTGLTSAEPPHPKAMVNMLVEEMAGDTNKVEVTGVLGQGSWGRVYSGRWRGLDVALKTLTFEMIKSDGDTTEAETVMSQEQRAIMEAAVSASVDHPNVVRTYFYDIQSIDTAGTHMSTGLHIDDATHEAKGAKLQTYKLFLVQELCSVPLSEVFVEGLRFEGNTRPTILLLLLDIASGLEYLHSRNIVHGDLKPANILLCTSTTSPSGVVAKLADFGLSARLGGDATHVSNYNSGTPFYVAPEVVVERRTSPASDIFSLGVILWQLYSGMLPYNISPDRQFVWNPAFPQFMDAQPLLPYYNVTQRCLQRNPKDRLSATEVIDQLTMIYNVICSEASDIT